MMINTSSYVKPNSLFPVCYSHVPMAINLIPSFQLYMKPKRFLVFHIQFWMLGVRTIM